MLLEPVERGRESGLGRAYRVAIGNELELWDGEKIAHRARVDRVYFGETLCRGRSLERRAVPDEANLKEGLAIAREGEGKTGDHQDGKEKVPKEGAAVPDELHRSRLEHREEFSHHVSLPFLLPARVRLVMISATTLST